jgi:CRISPR-associated endonuclease/helicase Cas3
VNRKGDDADAEIFWIENPAPVSAKARNPRAPYEPGEVERALEKIRSLHSASPDALPQEDGPAPWKNVLRKADLLDLFDTTPDLSGNQLDVSRFIRDTEERDVYVAWREWDGDAAPPDSLADLESRELCPVSIGDMRDFMGKKHVAYSWNFATERWGKADRNELYAGMMLVVRCGDGGYTAEEGWSPESKVRVEPVPSAKPAPGTEGDSADWLSLRTYRQTLVDHTRRVVEEMEQLLEESALDAEMRNTLLHATERHDWGKAHSVFQKTMHRNEPGTELLAKQVGKGKHEVPHFRHELASALGMLTTGSSDLEAYLVAAHHGKIRVSIRSMPGEKGKVRGIQDGDILPVCELAPGLFVPQATLSLAVMEFGAAGGSWTERMLRLREEFGPFRLAFLEMLLRAADEKASAEPNPEEAACTN